MAETYPEWLGEPFIDEAEYLRDVNETTWRWECLRGSDGTRVDEIPDGNDHGIDAVRYAMMDDALCG